jgi:hypothetical protein
MWGCWAAPTSCNLIGIWVHRGKCHDFMGLGVLAKNGKMLDPGKRMDKEP